MHILITIISVLLIIAAINFIFAVYEASRPTPEEKARIKAEKREADKRFFKEVGFWAFWITLTVLLIAMQAPELMKG